MNYTLKPKIPARLHELHLKTKASGMPSWITPLNQSSRPAFMNYTLKAFAAFSMSCFMMQPMEQELNKHSFLLR